MLSPEGTMRAERLLSIVLLLQTRGRMTAGELADTLAVSERTIYRDLDALDSAGIPVYTERGPGGGCMLVEGYRTSLTGLTETEVRTLFMSSVPGPLADLGLSQALDDALLKLLAALPSTYRSHAERVRQRILLDAAGWFQPQEPVPHLNTLQEAVWEDRLIRITYRKGDSQHVERTLAAYGLVAKASIWYLIGAVDEQIRVYRVSRIQAASLCDEFFERPDDFDLPAIWAEQCATFEASRPQYSVTLRLATELLPVLPHIFGEGIHILIEQAGPPDNSGWLTLTLIFETLEAARTTVLGFGALAEVLDPPELRQNVIDMARRIVVFYEAKR
jgi:predicted DNA-binding transcriptional regulator YafY